MQEQHLTIRGPSGQLEVIFTPNTGSIGVIVCHPHPLYGGTMTNKVVTTLCKNFSELGYPTLRFNFRGIGQSAGEFDHGIGETADTLAVIHWLKIEHGIDTVILAGFSFGAFVALNACQHFTVKHLLLVAPPTEYPEFNHLTAPNPWSLIVAAEDEVVSTPAILAWAQQQTPPCHFLSVEGASHFFHGKLAVLNEFIHQHFIAESLTHGH